MSSATADKILDVAEQLTQTRGFNGFSYRDLADAVGIKTASIHYHFPAKHDLAFQLADRYVGHFAEVLRGIDATHANAADRLTALGQIFDSAVGDGRFCLCLMLTTDRESLPAQALERASDFFNHTQAWIERTVRLGQEQGTVITTIDPPAAAAQFLAVLEGGMLVAQARSEPAHLTNLYHTTLAAWLR